MCVRDRGAEWRVCVCVLGDLHTSDNSRLAHKSVVLRGRRVTAHGPRRAWVWSKHAERVDDRVGREEDEQVPVDVCVGWCDVVEVGVAVMSKGKGPGADMRNATTTVSERADLVVRD
jgi:hypothetical protein